MDAIIGIINLFANEYNIDISDIENTQGKVNEEMKPHGWVLVETGNKTCAALKWNEGMYENEGYLLNEERILNVFGNDEANRELELLETGIVDLDHGSRFEGQVLRDSGIPFGLGEMYDDDGKLIYKGIIINGKRIGFGRSYHDNGALEYEGFWCDNHFFGTGKIYNRKSELMKDCVWYYSNTIAEEYEGFGCSFNVGLKRIKLFNKCTLKDWDVSLFLSLESIEIGDECFTEVKRFRIDSLNRLKSLKVGKNSFSEKKKWGDIDGSKSFHVLNCEQLELIEISRKSFYDFAGQFELRNLPALKKLEIGTRGRDSINFFFCSFIIRGT